MENILQYFDDKAIALERGNYTIIELWDWFYEALETLTDIETNEYVNSLLEETEQTVRRVLDTTADLLAA